MLEFWALLSDAMPAGRMSPGHAFQSEELKGTGPRNGFETGIAVLIASRFFN